MAHEGYIHPSDPTKAWTGYEYVSLARYNELRATTMPELPQLQGALTDRFEGAPNSIIETVPHNGGFLSVQEAADALERAGAMMRKQSDTFYMQQELAPKASGPHIMFREPAMIVENMRELLTYIDPDPSRGGIAETPERAASAWLDWTRGYTMDPADVLKVFEDGAEGCDEMVVVRDIPFYSHCEHHLAPIFGTVTIGYLPNERIVGLSKFKRLTDVFARRLQVQERMTVQIADAIMEHVRPKGCGVVVTARHLCMESRGVQTIGSMTTSSALKGLFRDDERVRAEFLNLARTK